jgi:hypothetical protein
MVRMAQREESVECLTNGDTGAGMPFLGDFKHSAGNDACDREVGSDKTAGAVDVTQTKMACDDDEDMDDDVAMTFPQRVSLKRERSEVSRQFMPAHIQGLIGRWTIMVTTEK